MNFSNPTFYSGLLSDVHYTQHTGTCTGAHDSSFIEVADFILSEAVFMAVIMILWQ